jgi:MerR family transcriptional regulator/heat shock protein HspR
MREEDESQHVYYHITTVARLLNLSTRTILRYERLGLIQCEAMVESPVRHRCYTLDTLDRLRRIKCLTADLGVNLAGVEVILQLLDRLQEAKEMESGG